MTRSKTKIKSNDKTIINVSYMFHTSKVTSAQHLHEQHGPTIFKTASFFSFCMVYLGMKGCQFWITYPIGLPGGDWISS